MVTYPNEECTTKTNNDIKVKENNRYCTANIFSGSIGFYCGTNPTAVSMHFSQTNNANIECKNCKKYLQWVVCKKCSETAVKLQWDLYNSENL